MSAKQYKFFGQVQEINDRGETVDAGWSCMAAWAQWSDYARLQAEVERLQHQEKYWRIEAETDAARWLRTLADLERLRTAGDMMAKNLDEHGWYPSVELWNLAKQGHPLE